MSAPAATLERVYETGGGDVPVPGVSLGTGTLVADTVPLADREVVLPLLDARPDAGLLRLLTRLDQAGWVHPGEDDGEDHLGAAHGPVDPAPADLALLGVRALERVAAHVAALQARAATAAAGRAAASRPVDVVDPEDADRGRRRVHLMDPDGHEVAQAAARSRSWVEDQRLLVDGPLEAWGGALTEGSLPAGAVAAATAAVRARLELEHVGDTEHGTYEERQAVAAVAARRGLMELRERRPAAAARWARRTVDALLGVTAARRYADVRVRRRVEVERGRDGAASLVWTGPADQISLAHASLHQMAWALRTGDPVPPDPDDDDAVASSRSAARTSGLTHAQAVSDSLLAAVLSAHLDPASAPQLLPDGRLLVHGWQGVAPPGDEVGRPPRSAQAPVLGRDEAEGRLGRPPEGHLRRPPPLRVQALRSTLDGADDLPGLLVGQQVLPAAAARALVGVRSGEDLAVERDAQVAELARADEPLDDPAALFGDPAPPSEPGRPPDWWARLVEETGSWRDGPPTSTPAGAPRAPGPEGPAPGLHRDAVRPLADLALDVRVEDVLVDPATGRAVAPPDVAAPTTTYRPGAGQARHAATAWPTCAVAGCERPSEVCDLDHQPSWATSGVTRADALHPRCRTHHLLVTHGGWSVSALADGTLVTRTRRGLTTCSPPADLLESARLALAAAHLCWGDVPRERPWRVVPPAPPTGGAPSDPARRDAPTSTDLCPPPF